MNESIGYLVHDTARLFRRSLNGRMQRDGVTWLQWRLLANLSRSEGMNQAKLAEILEVEPITLSRMVDRLANAGFVERRPDPSDRRAYGLFLLGPAHALVDNLRIEARHVEDMALSGMTGDDREMLAQLLTRMRANLLQGLDAVGRTDTEEEAA